MVSVVCDKVLGSAKKTNYFACVDRNAARFLRDVRNGFGLCTRAAAGVAKPLENGEFEFTYVYRH